MATKKTSKRSAAAPERELKLPDIKRTRSSAKAEGSVKEKSGSGRGAAKAAKPEAKAPGRKASRTAPAAEQIEAKPRFEHMDEVVGVIFIALGIVLGILTYTNAAAIAKGLIGVCFGLVGVVQYAVPVLFVVIGIMLIAIPRRQAGTGTVLMILGAVWCVSCVIHIASVGLADEKFGAYVSAAYELGRSGKGGGVLASVPVFGLVKLLSRPGAIVVFIAAAIVLLLLATRTSIRSAGRKIVAKVDAMEDRRKARLINERVGDDIPVGRRRRAHSAETVSAPQPADEPDDLRIGDGEGDLRETYEARRKRGKLKAEKADLDSVLSSAESADPAEPGLDFLPTSGRLPRSYRKSSSLNVPVIKKAEPPKNETKPKVEDYDPFETIEIHPEPGAESESAFVDLPPFDVSFPPVTELASSKEEAVTEEPAKPAPDGEAAPAEGETPETSAPPVVYRKPPISLLRLPDRSESIANDSPEEKASLLIETLSSFNISAKVSHISVGPVITRFEIQPAPGTRVNRITSLSNDIALALAAPRVRIEAPIPGKAAVGIEIPNKDTAMVRLREVIDTREFSTASSPLTFALGKDIAGKPVYANLEKMPHMLIAGATGSGKSVCINSIILSTVYKSTPDEVRMILIDPKVVELSIFAPVPHLYCPIVTDPKKAAGVLKWACNEMDQRYTKMSKINARDLERYNSLQEDPADRMPRLMIIIDELADLMMVSAKDVEDSIARLAQLGRACGIHLIVATQRPSVDILTGLIKANIPSRIAFAVSSAIDSRVILDGGGAEKLLGHGDMLFHPNGAAKPTRAQGAYVSDEEVENIMHFFEENRIEIPQNESVLDAIPDLTGAPAQGNGKQEDDLLPDAVRIVMDSGSASISMIQRRLRVGYARAARLVDIMEQHKFVSGFDGSKPRKVLIDEAGYREFFGGGYAPAESFEEDAD